MFDFCPYQKAKTWFKQYYSRQAPKLLVFPPVFQSVACFRLRLRTLDWFLSVGTSETGSQLTLPWWQKGDWNELLKVERAYGYEFAMMVGEWWVSHLMLFMQAVDCWYLWSLMLYTLHDPKVVCECVCSWFLVLSQKNVSKQKWPNIRLIKSACSTLYKRSWLTLNKHVWNCWPLAVVDVIHDDMEY